MPQAEYVRVQPGKRFEHVLDHAEDEPIFA